MSVQTRLVTVEEFLRIPDPKEGRHELHHGEVVLVMPVKWGHQQFQDRIQMILKRMIGDKGKIYMEFVFRPLPEHEVWTADVGFVRAERARQVAPDEYLMGAPDLVVEVLSPSNTMDEMNDRMALCLANGCSSFWIVDPKRQKVSVTEGNVTRHYGVGEALTCSLLPAELAVRDIFANQ